MDGLISFGLGLLAFVSAFCLAGLARAMRNDKLPPNMWAGIRTKAALESESVNGIGFNEQVQYQSFA